MDPLWIHKLSPVVLRRDVGIEPTICGQNVPALSRLCSGEAEEILSQLLQMFRLLLVPGSFPTGSHFPVKGTIPAVLHFLGRKGGDVLAHVFQPCINRRHFFPGIRHGISRPTRPRYSLPLWGRDTWT